MIGKNQGYPSFRLDLLSTSAGKYLSLYADYFDDQNINADLEIVVGSRFSLESQFRSLSHQEGQDMLTNLSAREYFESTSSPGGKFLSHKVLDPGAKYSTNRNEIVNKLNVLLSEKNDVRLIAAHRSIIEKGTAQQTSTNHCWGCHVESDTRQVDYRTHQVEAGIQAEVDPKSVVGYTFGYRRFESKGDDVERYYDTASHPVFVDSVPLQIEFGSRLVFNDTTLRVGVRPDNEKQSHKVRFTGDFGEGRLVSSLGFTRVENLETEWKTDAIMGAVNYTRPLGPRTRLIARVNASRLSSDEQKVNLPLFRAGRPGPDGIAANVNFDYIPYSVIDRLNAKATAEVIHRMNPKMTLSVLAGYQLINRDDYPEHDNGLKTDRFIGQAKIRYRHSAQFSGWAKYRIEKTWDPFVSGRGLFEYPGRDSLSPLIPTGGSRYFYFQREDIRYQNITTEPTDYHEFEIRGTMAPDPMVSINAGLQGVYDKNGDLDSLDVKHFSIAPNLNVNVMPTEYVVASAGYTYNYYKSRGPVTVALFDG
jgi:hypothetical protein